MKNILIDLSTSEQDNQWHVEKHDFDTFSMITKDKQKNIFNKALFSELNADKISDIIYMIIYKKGSARFALTMGIGHDNELRCPFSAPFGYPEETKPTQSISDYYHAAIAINKYVDQLESHNVSITFPPLFYDNEVITAWVNALAQNGWVIDYFEINYAFHIPEILENYETKIARNARKNLRIAEHSGLQIVNCINESEKREAYHIIKKNREAKGYPLRMTEEQVMKTINLVNSDMYMVSLESENIASALVYEVTDNILQVIYWGDVPGYSDKKPINFLAYELLKIYSGKGYEYLDIGPATEQGIADFGLCDFKDSIGCKRCLKIRMSRRTN